jgi:hypothetical protein
MSINMKVLPISDDDVASIAVDPKRLEDPSVTSDAAELYDHWREIDFVLGGQSFIMKGDIVLHESKSEPIHAIRSNNVPSLEAALSAISGNELRQRLDPVRMRAAGLWVPEYPQYVDKLFTDLSSALNGLRGVVASAAAQGKGLVVWRHEGL